MRLLSIPVLLLVLTLTACQEPGVTTRPSSGDATGRMGEVVQGQSRSEVYIELSAAYLREGALQESLKNAKKAVLVEPRSPKAHNMLAIVHQRLGQNGLAEQHFSKAVALDAHDPYVLNAYGSFLCSQARYAEADTYYKRALANPLYPTPWAAAHNAGICAEKQNKVDEAEDSFRRALRENPRFAPSLLRMAHITFHQENYLSTRAYLQRDRQVAEPTADSLWLAIRTERQLGNKDQVASYEMLLRKKFPDSKQTSTLDRSNRQ